MFQTAILVLLYRREMINSNTLTSLKKLNRPYENTKLVIWNNGPKSFNNRNVIAFEELGYIVEMKETLNNESLAVIYNYFLSKNNAERYILLDDDSCLTDEYVLASLNINTTEVGMPLIKVGGEVQSPQINYQPCSLSTRFTQQDRVVTIGSGLIIGVEVVTEVSKLYGDVFDERFYLYGVDVTFCFRLFEANLVDRIKITTGFEHSLSRLEKEAAKITKYRRIERGYDRGLRFRYYYPFPSSLFLTIELSLKILRRMVLRMPYHVNVFALLKAYFTGKHHRFKPH